MSTRSLKENHSEMEFTAPIIAVESCKVPVEASNEKKKILVYSYSVWETNVRETGYVNHPYWPFEKEEYKMELPGFSKQYSDALIPEAPSFENFDIVVVRGGVLVLAKGEERSNALRQEEIYRRENEVFAALEKGRTVCFLFSAGDELVKRVLWRMNIATKILPKKCLKPDLKCRREEFGEYMKFVMAEAFYEGEALEPIYFCDAKIVGFYRQVDNGILLFLPYHLTGDYDYSVRFFNTLARALVDFHTYKEPPSWIEHEIKLHDEVETEKEIAELSSKVAPLKDKEAEFFENKSVLYLGGVSLEEPVINLVKSMGFATERSAKIAEDFMIIDEKKKPIVLCEIKSSAKDIKDKHLIDIERHKIENDLELSFPSLLIVNTRINASSLKEKDASVPSKIIKEAKKRQILIMRTLDLIWAYSAVKEGKLTLSKLLELFKMKSGWLKVNDDGSVEVLED